MDKLELLALRIRRCQDNSGPLRVADDIQEMLTIMADMADVIAELRAIGATNKRASNPTDANDV